MVSTDEVLHFGGQVITACLLEAFSYMGSNHSRTFGIVQLVVWVEVTSLVLCKIKRVAYLAYVVVESPHFG